MQFFLQIDCCFLCRFILWHRIEAVIKPSWDSRVGVTMNNVNAQQWAGWMIDKCQQFFFFPLDLTRRRIKATQNTFSPEQQLLSTKTETGISFNPQSDRGSQWSGWCIRETYPTCCIRLAVSLLQCLIFYMSFALHMCIALLPIVLGYFRYYWKPQMIWLCFKTECYYGYFESFFEICSRFSLAPLTIFIKFF